MKTDEICDKYEINGAKISLSLLVDDETNEPSTVLVEGGVSALKMLGELLIAVAEESDNESFFISPVGPGRLHFAKNSKLGIYINRID